MGKLGQVKYGENKKGVGEVRESVGRCVGGVKSVLGCGKVWGVVGMGSRCVEVCLGCGKGVEVGAKQGWQLKNPPKKPTCWWVFLGFLKYNGSHM